jgi:hypothetical protein
VRRRFTLKAYLRWRAADGVGKAAAEHESRSVPADAVEQLWEDNHSDHPVVEGAGAGHDRDAGRQYRCGGLGLAGRRFGDQEASDDPGD